MDHHCPWLINCIGMRNYKFFFLTVVYAAVGALVMAVTYSTKWPDIIATDENGDGEWSFPMATVCSMAYFLMIFLAILLNVFLIFHIYLLIRNFTTLEHFEKRRENHPKW